ncbi:dephospho-CoA kinase [Clostridia bacterium]|nr:dephospho-CoA kinase [Clostridia bacterium]
MIIGLTGNMGTGKTTVARFLRSKGALIIDADQLAREVVAPGRPAYEDIVAFFGKEILNQNKEIDRKVLGKIVFGDAPKREQLEKFIHPRIINRMNTIIEKQGKETVIVIDAPLLIEAGLHKRVDKVWVTDCSKSTQADRIKKRDGLSDKEIEKRLSSQMSSEEKLSYADLVIDTNGSKQMVQKYLDEVWDKQVLGKIY